MTRQLLAFSRQQVLEPKVLNLNDIVADIEKMLRRLIGEDIELRTMLDPALSPVKADPGQIEQVVMNLAVNARDAMPNGGRLLIETRNTELDEAYALNHPPCMAGGYVLLSVSDTGIGMDQNTRAKIFEPFFTTKGLGKGTGLGLSTVYGVVRQSGGHIWVDSEPGQGAVFKIYLPFVDVLELPAPSKPASHPIGGAETILLVEDDPSLRALAREFLEQAGYTVFEADGGVNALAFARQHPEAIQLLLSDVVMPGMAGTILAEKLVAIHPETRVLHISGYAGGFVSSSGILEKRANLLQKPFSRNALLRRVREILDTQ